MLRTAFALPLVCCLAAADLPELPRMEAAKQGAILLWAGSAAPASTAPSLAIAAGTVAGHAGDDYATQNAADVVTGHKDFGSWETTLRFALPKGHPHGAFTLWARWKQGGEPEACPQKFEVSAGADDKSVTPRCTATMKPAGWEYAWASGGEIAIKAEDQVVTVRISGNGHDAKVFNALLLGGKPAR